MDSEYTQVMAHHQSTHWWYEGRREILRSIISGLGLPKTARILEAGCGPGANLVMLSEFGDVHAFEPDAFSAEHAGKISGKEVRQGFLPSPVPFDGEFDLVGAFDVIEHIEDDLGAVKSLYGLSRAGGYAVFTVPAFQFLWSYHDEINHHKRRYTRASLAKILKAAGYEITFISYYNFWLFPPAVAVRLIKTVLRLRETGDIETPSSDFINRLFLNIFRSEKFFLKFFALPVGLSVLVVCRKSR